MPNGHILSCPALKDKGECTCEAEARRYIKLAGYSSLAFVVDLSGWIAGSYGLLADLFHVAIDLSENLLSVFIARRARFSDNEAAMRRRGAAASAALIFLLTLVMGVEAIERIAEPGHIDLRWAIPLAVIGLCINLRQFFVHDEAPAEHRNLTHRWQLYHIALDAMGSIIALLGLSLGALGFERADAYAAIAIILLIWGRLGWMLLSGGAGHHHHHHHDGHDEH